MRLDRRTWVLGATAALGAGAQASAWVLRHPQPQPHDRVGHFAVALVSAALARLDPKASLQALSRAKTSQGRVLRDMADGLGPFDLVWTMTSLERERSLHPVRVPIDRGLLGWRVLLVRAAERARWSRVRKLAELATARAGQGLHWPDTAVLRANGLRVETAAEAGNLFAMLEQGHIDFFPRSVLEVGDELRAQRSAGRALALAPGLLLRYPTASYLFLRRGLQAEAAQLQRTLDAMSRDGSLQALFDRHFRRELQALRLPSRHVLALRNPELPPATPLGVARYWF